MSIITLVEFTDYLRNEIGAQDVTHTSSALAAAEQALNEACARNWTVAGASSARIYSPDCRSSILRIHDCTTITSVVESSSTVNAADYQAQPNNHLSWSGQAEPYQELLRLNGVEWYWSYGLATVTVTAAWGWLAIPSQIVEACKVIGKTLVELRNARGGVVASDVFGPVRSPRDVTGQVGSLIDRRLRRAEAFGIA